ncbi:pseudaminic acid cytidylyltransferase [Shewanella metallivivens]|uniref:Pseudaminic acid cytidylyltransferase n=1 Tax=Shewanella metallivivens TaxID=2872342 RepID=A0ABT5TJ63_9GAMM|nr:pseudaminic acid cytidylyltransferase [Shewanella metallivivens]MDD8058640.1 pseudaminic acid cytidylyltransferase [Shewanella metallivivens]
MLKILAIIPARGGSKRIPDKNIKSFLGKEIISYPIQALKSVKRVTKIIVSTDSEKIKKVAEKYNCLVPYMRSEKNSDDFATTFDVISEVIDKESDVYDYICCVYPTSVFTTPEILNEAIDRLISNKQASSICSVLEYSHPIQRSLKNKSGFLVSNNPENYNCRSQDLEVNYHDAGQFYIFKPYSALNEAKLITKKCIPYIIKPNHAQDIDTHNDWTLAELKYTLKNNKPML